MRLTRPVFAVAVALSVIAMAGCTYKPRTGPIESGPGSTKSARSFLEGRWSLVSFVVYPPGKDPVEAKGSGVLVYDNFSNLTMDINVDEGSAAVLQNAGIMAEKGRFSSKGRTIIDMQGRTLTYVLEGQSATGASSGPLALNRPRHWQVDGDVLTLTTKDDNGNPMSVGKWKKQ